MSESNRRLTLTWIALTLLAAACASTTSPPPAQKTRAEDPRVYTIPPLDLKVAGAGFGQYDGKVVHLRISDPVTKETAVEQAVIEGGAFEVDWDGFYQADRVAYMVDYYIDADADGACGEGSDPAWRTMAENKPWSEEEATIRLEVDGAVSPTGDCGFFTPASATD